MTAGDLRDPAAMLIVGFRGFRDFYPPYIAANLATFNAAPVRHLYLDVPAFRSRRHLLSLDIARALDDAPTCREVGRMVKANLGDAARVGFPAVLGLDAHRQVVDELQEIMGRPIFEIPTLPPSVPGIRINGALRRRLLRAGARVEIGFWVEGHLEGTQATEILVESAGQPTVYRADAFVLATGGIGGGGIRTDRDGALQEAVFGLPVEGPGDRTTWHLPHFLGRESQPISLAGIRTNDRLQPLSASGRPVENLFVTASNLPGWDPVHEGSGEGVALATGYKAAAEALAALGTGAAHLSSTPRR
jgi:glycerol-3-phosphate dehydrogenase subunit B